MIFPGGGLIQVSRCRRWAFLLLVWLAHGRFADASLRAQEHFTVTRGDEVGPRRRELPEDAFLLQLSYDHPLESVGRYLRTDGAFRNTFGSVSADQFLIEQDLKAKAELDENFTARFFVHHTIDLDSDWLQLQLLPEYHASENLSIGVPAILDSDKGKIDVGLAATYREPDAYLDYLRLSVIRTDLLFDGRSNEFEHSETRRAGFSVELQAQVPLGAAGTVSLKAVEQTPYEVDFVERGARESFERLLTEALYRLDLTACTRLFLVFDTEHADEASVPLGGNATALDFDSKRDLYRGRVEVQHDLVGADSAERVRGGVQFVYYVEEAEQAQPFDRIDFPYTLRRREPTAFAGYRCPLGYEGALDVETMAYAGYYFNDNSYPFNPPRDDRDPRFQGKLSVLPRWVFSADAEVALHLSVELDRLHWAGGGLMARIFF